MRMCGNIFANFHSFYFLFFVALSGLFMFQMFHFFSRFSSSLFFLNLQKHFSVTHCFFLYIFMLCHFVLIILSFSLACEFTHRLLPQIPLLLTM